MPGHPPYHTDKFCVRYIDAGQCDTQIDVWNAIVQTTAMTMEKLGLPGYLFVTVIGAESLSTAPGECGFALYHSGMQHIAVAGGDGPDELKDDRAHWLREVRLSTAHELVHYWQEINGKLNDSTQCEDEAEAMAHDILGLTPIQPTPD